MPCVCAWAGIFRIPGCLATGDDGVAGGGDGSIATVAGSNNDTFFTDVD